MRFIEHIIEPSKLLLAWQTLDEKHRTRYIVGEIKRDAQDTSLSYLPGTADFEKAKKLGFEAYPAFQEINKIHTNVLDTFMRRLPPRTRGDFAQYLESLRLRPHFQISDFALLGYSGAKLLSDGFSIIHPFLQAEAACELLIEAAGYRHIQQQEKCIIHIGDIATFKIEFSDITKEKAIRIEVDEQVIGYVNRGLIPTFLNWIEQSRIAGAWIEKINETSSKPSVYVFVKVDPM